MDHYSQTIPTQILNKDGKTTIMLKIFENEGATAVSHVELHFAPYEELISGVLVEKSVAHLVWDNKFDDKIIGIYDDDNLLRKVNISAENEDGFKIIIFEFEPTTVLNNITIMTNIWDERRNAVKNYFEDAIKVVDMDNIEILQPNDTKMTIPEWIKNNAGWWANGYIDDNSFVQGIQFLIKEGIMKIQS